MTYKVRIVGQPRKRTETPAAGRYRIQAVAEMTGIPAPTLRAWERRYGIPAPERTEAAYRLYSDHDVALVKRLDQLCAGGLAPAEAARLLKEEDQAAPPAPTGKKTADAFTAASERMVAAISAFDPEGLEAEISQALALGSASAIFERVIAPAQRRVGELWHAGALSVGQEHLGSEALGCAVRSLLRLVLPPDAERTVVLACFAEEEHVLPLYGVAFRVASWGMRPVLLGSRTPPPALEAVRVALEPDLIGLSVTLAPPPYQARELVRAYAAAAGKTPWLVGGLGAGELATLVEEAGGIVVREPSELKAIVDRALGKGKSARRKRDG